MILGCQLDEAGSKSMERNAWNVGNNAPMRQRCEVRLGLWRRAKGLVERLVTRGQGILFIYFALLPLAIALGVGVLAVSALRWMPDMDLLGRKAARGGEDRD